MLILTIVGIKTNIQSVTDQPSGSLDNIRSHLERLDEAHQLQATVPFLAAIVTLWELSVGQKGNSKLVIRYFENNIKQAITNTNMHMADDAWSMASIDGNT